MKMHQAIMKSRQQQLMLSLKQLRTKESAQIISKKFLGTKKQVKLIRQQQFDAFVAEAGVSDITAKAELEDEDGKVTDKFDVTVNDLRQQQKLKNLILQIMEFGYLGVPCFNRNLLDSIKLCRLVIRTYS